MDDRPGSNAVSEFFEVCVARAVQDVRGSNASLLQLLVVAVVQFGTEHDVEVGAVGDGKVDVGDTDVEEGGATTGCVESVAESPVALHGDRREQPGLVAEVVGGGGMGHAGSAGDLTQPERGWPAVTDCLKRGAQQRGSQVTVMIWPL